jgi:hypothetical protein
MLNNHGEGYSPSIPTLQEDAIWVMPNLACPARLSGTPVQRFRLDEGVANPILSVRQRLR